VTSAQRSPSWRRYLRFWGSDPARDLDDELRFHLESRYDEFVAAGMDPALARAEAERRFGNVVGVREQCEAIDSQWTRERTMLDIVQTIGADFRYAFRQLRRNTALNVAAILCFALGIGANTSIFSVVDAVLFRPLPFRDPARLVLVGEGLPRFGTENFGVISAPEFEDYQRLNGRVFSASAMYEGESYALGGSGEPERVVGLSGSADLFDVFGVSMAKGRGFAPGDLGIGSPSVVVISDALWRRRFGADTSIIGRSIDVDGRPTTIIGLARPEFRFPLPAIGGAPADVFVPYKMTSDVQRQRGNAYRTFLVARLAPGVSLASAKRAVADLATSLPVLHPEFYGKNWKTVADAFPLRDQTTKDVRRPLILLLSAVGMVLLIACINVSSLLIARAAARRREISVRRALGASRARLVQQFFTESFVLVSIAGVLGVAVATTGARMLAAHAPRAVLQGYDVSVDSRVLAATALVVALTALVFSLVPAFTHGRGSVGMALHDDGRASTAGRARQRGRRLLVVTEISLALMLAAAAGLMVRSFLRARSVDPGFDPEHAVSVRVGLLDSRYPSADQIIGFETRLLDQLRQLPGVRAASATNELPMGDNRIRFAFSVEGANVPKIPIASGEVVYPDYFDAMRIPIRRGRALDRSDVKGSLRVAVVNEALAKKFFGDRGAIGRRLKSGSPESHEAWLTVVGVAADVKETGLDQTTEPAIYFPALQEDSIAAQNFIRSVAYVVRTDGDLDATMRDMTRTIRAADPTLPLIGMRRLTDVVDVSVAERRFNTLLLGAFAILALVLAAVGIYGLMAYSVVQRTREIGIRLAIGATPSSVLGLVVGQGARIAVAGVVIGLIGCVALTRVLGTLLFDVSPFDPIAFGVAAALLLGVAAVASYLPARRAARIDPQSAIRSE